MEIELEKIDFGKGYLGLLVGSMVGHTGLTFVPEDEGVVGISTRISPRSKKLLEQFSEIGGVSQAIITRICIESGLGQISQLLVEVKKAKEAASEAENAEYEAMAEFNPETFDTEVVGTLSALRKAASARKAAK